jgi:hypothetical protein
MSLIGGHILLAPDRETLAVLSMKDPQVGWIAAIIIGGVAGWLAEQFMKSDMGLSKGAPAPSAIFLCARSNNKSSVRACLFAVQPSCCGASDANKKSVINQTTCGSGQTIFAWSNIFWVGATYSGASGALGGD